MNSWIILYSDCEHFFPEKCRFPISPKAFPPSFRLLVLISVWVMNDHDPGTITPRGANRATAKYGANLFIHLGSRWGTYPLAF